MVSLIFFNSSPKIADICYGVTLITTLLRHPLLRERINQRPADTGPAVSMGTVPISGKRLFLLFFENIINEEWFRRKGKRGP